MYVILNPHSSTNPSDSHRVVDYDEWIAHVNGERQSFNVAAERKTFSEAVAIQKELNDGAQD